jgi:hypothetical protein
LNEKNGSDPSAGVEVSHVALAKLPVEGSRTASVRRRTAVTAMPANARC